ncbi:hypothetical protein SAMN02745165_01521 [Malonomonas rubra DSM 5091]|uniref:Uncharacterized protein n=1 Tax=Malonomonas rubra DSM 5091 TaxID=1122189 RepID=A0A1M6GEK6_MALRU|nr:hypothetical protein [Malonomonas rubra]SHJ08358.1 hypothetical protein SAMN02745165_01521 [Malonomonas rubra DSM 5091]
MKITQIKVVYLDGTTGVVSNDVLDVLIATGKIKCFKRSDGWVDIIRDHASLRDYRNATSYPGPERRAPWPDAEQRKD